MKSNSRPGEAAHQRHLLHRGTEGLRGDPDTLNTRYTIHSTMKDIEAKLPERVPARPPLVHCAH